MRWYKYVPLIFLIFLITSSFTVDASCFMLENGLNLRDSGDQVKILQSKLSEDKTLYPSGIISGYYGSLTEQAVIKFQQKYGLTQTGNIDLNSLDKFNQVYGDCIQPTPTPALLPKKNAIQSFFDFITFPIRSIMSLFNRTDNNNQSTENNMQTIKVPTQTPTPVPTIHYIAPTIDPDPPTNNNVIQQQNNSPTQTPLNVQQKSQRIPVVLPHNGLTYYCDSSVAQSVKDASSNLQDANKQQADCINKNTSHKNTCSDSCGKSGQARLTLCQNDCENGDQSNFDSCSNNCLSASIKESDQCINDCYNNSTIQSANNLCYSTTTTYTNSLNDLLNSYCK